MQKKPFLPDPEREIAAPRRDAWKSPKLGERLPSPETCWKKRQKRRKLVVSTDSKILEGSHPSRVPSPVCMHILYMRKVVLKTTTLLCTGDYQSTELHMGSHIMDVSMDISRIPRSCAGRKSRNVFLRLILAHPNWVLWHTVTTYTWITQCLDSFTLYVNMSSTYRDFQRVFMIRIGYKTYQLSVSRLHMLYTCFDGVKIKWHIHYVRMKFLTPSSHSETSDNCQMLEIITKNLQFLFISLSHAKEYAVPSCLSHGRFECLAMAANSINNRRTTDFPKKQSFQLCSGVLWTL